MADNATAQSSGEQNTGAELTTQQSAGRPARSWQIRLMGWGLIAFALLLAYLFFVVWPSGLSDTARGSDSQFIFPFGSNAEIFGQSIQLRITLDVQIILMVMIVGGLGSFIHAATSFGDYVGNEKLTTNWIWWYMLRPFIGMILAAIFYLVIRGGFLSAGTEAGKINPFGIAALAGLVGMFSKQATDKLNEIFNTLFRTAGDDKRKDNLVNPVPSVTDILPQNIESKTENVIVTVKGTGFVKGAVIRINGINRETVFVDETQLTAKLLPEDVEAEGEVKVTIFNPAPGGGVSTPIKLKIAPTSAANASGTATGGATSSTAEGGGADD
jgi:hypothetical protein